MRGPERAILSDDLRSQLVKRVMARDGLSQDAAMRTVNALSIPELTRLEMEAREFTAPAFTADYDPYARN